MEHESDEVLFEQHRSGDRAAFRTIIERHQPDELLVTANIFDHGARLRSFEHVARVEDHLATA